MGCPSDDTLIELVEHALANDALGALETHIDRCSTCRTTVGHLAAVGGVRHPGDEVRPDNREPLDCDPVRELYKALLAR